MTQCDVCNEAITNPICTDCLQTEVTHWMEDFNAGNVEEVKSLKKLFAHFKSGVNCIICKNELNVCAHCYCKEAKRYVNPENDRKFIRAFDFELFELL
ncbi:hypothetical protein COV11_03430 [Candidatus Woesearchaeota archaeon CG10_big_fil_rev_8_21_14_0_10_30_7]|nr:MAG: hypothetical protein COV11_03430 [Candidatus Woesearchaeota archaeon CG10_big_fil_rev_8_21_14_0_10_30_7]